MAGAQFGYGMTWTLFLTLPFMAAIQIISAVIGWNTRRGLARNIATVLPAAALYPMVASLVANTINIAADLAAMGEALRLVVGGSALAYAAIFEGVCLIAEVLIPYHRYAGILKFMTLVLLFYVAAAFTVNSTVGRGRANDPPAQYQARSRRDPHGGRDLRHHHQPLSVFLAGFTGGGRIPTQPSRTTG